MKKLRPRPFMSAPLVLAIAFLTTTQFSERAVAQGVPSVPTSQAQNTEVPLEDYLYTVGKRLDCYFTIERDTSDSSHPDNLFGVEIAEDAKISTERELQTYLIQQVPGILVLNDPLSPDVLHIVARSLGALTCPLGRNVDIAYEGSLSLFPAALSTVCGSIVRSNFQFRGIGFAYDPTDCLVDVHSHGQDGRTVLTGALQLSSYDPVIWEADEFSMNGEWYTNIDFEPTSSSAKAQIAAWRKAGRLSSQ